MEQIPTSELDADQAIKYLQSIDASTGAPSAVCRIKFAAGGFIRPQTRVRQGDEVDVVLLESDFRVTGAGTSPRHGIATTVLDPKTGEWLISTEHTVDTDTRAEVAR